MFLDDSLKVMSWDVLELLIWPEKSVICDLSYLDISDFFSSECVF